MSRQHGSTATSPIGTGISASSSAPKAETRITKLFSEFEKNASRVKNLVRLYNQPGIGQGSGRKQDLASDLLRAAVVLLHATLETYLRGICKLNASNASKNFLNKVGFYVKQERDRTDKIQLGDLQNLKSMSIGMLMEIMIQRHMDEKQAFSDWDRMIIVLLGVGVKLDDAVKDNIHADISALMKRRHKIVHHSDLARMSGRGHQRTSTIRADVVKKWIKAVEDLALEIRKNH